MSKIQCLECGDVIESLYRHDFRKCDCGACFLDGGDVYLRYGALDMNKVRVIEFQGTKENEPKEGDSS